MKDSTPEIAISDTEMPAVHNREVAKSLEDYCHFEHPQGFAVMLTGQWGSGKTHFIKEILHKLARPGPDRKKLPPLYVSLYGVNEPSEIGDQLYQQLHPILNHKATRLLGAVLRSAAKATIKIDITEEMQTSGTLPNFELSSLLNGTKGRVIVFDDFERAMMKSTTILGYINPLVEHDECKVLVLADETQIIDREEYLKRKEKTIGQTFEFKADAQAAYLYFLDLVNHQEARQFLKSSQKSLINIFHDSQSNNLRILKQFFWDFERFWKSLIPEQCKHEAAMIELACLLCASSLELRSGNISEEHYNLQNNDHYISLHKDQENLRTINSQRMFEKYPTVKFNSTLIDAKTIIDLTVRSKLSISSVQTQLKRHPYFVSPEKMPSWRALWLSWEVSAIEHEGIVARFGKDFCSRKFSITGELLHVIGLALWLSDLKISGWESEDIVCKIKKYISDVYDNGEAEIDDLEESTFDVSFGAHAGLGFRNREDLRFKKLSEYLGQKRHAWQKRGYPAAAKLLHELMKNDSEAYLREVCFTNSGRPRFARIGVLKYIPAADFARTIVLADYGNQKNMLLALSIRYQQVTVESELKSEMTWLQDVKDHMYIEASKLPPIAKSHIEALIAQYIEKALKRAD